MKKLRPIVRQTARWDSRSCSRKCIKNTAIWFGSRRKRHQKTLLKITQQIRRHYYYYYFFFFSFFFFLFFFFFFFFRYVSGAKIFTVFSELFCAFERIARLFSSINCLRACSLASLAFLFASLLAVDFDLWIGGTRRFAVVPFCGIEVIVFFSGTVWKEEKKKKKKNKNKNKK